MAILHRDRSTLNDRPDTLSLMPILGHGIDLVDTPRIERLLGEHEQRFLDRVFTAGERAYCDGGGKMRTQRYAARFAAKEAVLKVLGTGWSSGIAWTDVEVQREGTGRPTVKLYGAATLIADRIGITAWHISLSHLRGHALASVIGEGD